MQDKENRYIVDCQGNVLKRTKENTIKEFVKNNIGNIWREGLAACITIAGMISVLISKNYSRTCANFYGIDGRYFSGTEMFEDKVIFVICVIILGAYPVLFSYITKKIDNKVQVIGIFILTFLILFAQNSVYLHELLESIPWWIKKHMDNYVVIIIFLASDIVISYFIIIRKFIYQRKKYGKFEKMIFVIALLIYIVSAGGGISTKINYDISDKKIYGVIEDNRVIISNYDGKFVVMGCKIQGETIILNKGTCSLEKMTGVSITYHKYHKVICK